MPPTDIERDLNRLESELKRLEAEYNMFFAGRSKKPPLDTRGRVVGVNSFGAESGSASNARPDEDAIGPCVCDTT